MAPRSGGAGPHGSLGAAAGAPRPGGLVRAGGAGLSAPPPVSVLLPVRDAAPHLPAAIRSLEAQTFGDFEVLAVDDGSGDETPGLLAAWAERDPRVRVVRTRPRGLVAALEVARGLARGRYLARMDGDDVALPARLALQYELMEADPDLAGCGARVEYFPRDRLGGGALRYQRWINALVEPEAIERDLFVECPLPHPTFFFRSAAVAAAGGYRERGWPEDYDLVLRLWRRGGRLGKVPRVLLRWREGEDRLSRSSPAYAPESFRRCKVHHLAATLVRGREGVVVWGAGPTGKAFARTVLEAGLALRAFVDVDPRKIGQQVYGVPVVAAGDTSRFRGSFSVAAVGQPGARERVRELFREGGWREMVDCCAVA